VPGLRHSGRLEQSGGDPPVRDPGLHVAGPEPEGPQDVDRRRDQLRVGEDLVLPDDVHVELEVLPQAALLRTLVSEELGDRVPAHRLRESGRPRRHHPGEGRGHLRPQGHLPPALVLEGVELLDDLLAGLLRVQLEGLQRRPVVLDEAVPLRHLAPRLEDVSSERQLLGEELPEAGEARYFVHAPRLR